MNTTPCSWAPSLQHQALLFLLVQNSHQVRAEMPGKKGYTTVVPLDMYKNSATDALIGESPRVRCVDSGGADSLLRIDGPSDRTGERRSCRIDDSVAGASRKRSTALELLRRNYIAVVNNLPSPGTQTPPTEPGTLTSKVEESNANLPKLLRRSLSEEERRVASNSGCFPLPPLRKVKKARSLSLKLYKSLWANSKMNSLSGRREFFARCLEKGNGIILARSRSLKVIDSALMAATRKDSRKTMG